MWLFHPNMIIKSKTTRTAAAGTAITFDLPHPIKCWAHGIATKCYNLGADKALAKCVNSRLCESRLTLIVINSTQSNVWQTNGNVQNSGSDYTVAIWCGTARNYLDNEVKWRCSTCSRPPRSRPASSWRMRGQMQNFAHEYCRVPAVRTDSALAKVLEIRPVFLICTSSLSSLRVS